MSEVATCLASASPSSVEREPRGLVGGDLTSEDDDDDGDDVDDDENGESVMALTLLSSFFLSDEAS